MTTLSPFGLSLLRFWPLLALVLAAACGGAGDNGVDAESTETQSLTTEASPTPRIPDVEGWLTDWSKTTIDTSELIRGISASDPRDRITPLDEPTFETVDQASDWLDDREPVALFKLNGDARAYPLRILIWHEIVNDEVDGMPVVITYCPLCNTALAFDRRVGGTTLTFGTSGLLRNSDLVMWDRQTESLWQQATGEGIVGELAGEQLEYLPLSLVSWKDFKEGFRDGRVLSQDTGFSRAYGNNPYEFYDSASRPFLFNGEIDDRFSAMERVVGVIVGDTTRGYPFSVIKEEKAVNDEVGGEPIVVLWGSEDTASVLSEVDIADGRAIGVGVAYSRDVGGQILTFTPDGQLFRDEETGTIWNILGQGIDGPLAGDQLDLVTHANHLWFAWAAFYPDTEVYEGSGD